MKENDTLMVVSDKASMLNDIPAMCRLIMCKQLHVFKTSDLMIFLIKNKKWHEGQEMEKEKTTRAASSVNDHQADWTNDTH